MRESLSGRPYGYISPEDVNKTINNLTKRLDNLTKKTEEVQSLHNDFRWVRAAYEMAMENKGILWSISGSGYSWKSFRYTIRCIKMDCGQPVLLGWRRMREENYNKYVVDIVKTETYVPIRSAIFRTREEAKAAIRVQQEVYAAEVRAAHAEIMAEAKAAKALKAA